MYLLVLGEEEVMGVYYSYEEPVACSVYKDNNHASSRD